uniref:Uncharacterized protein n=1 Tax=Anopheles atroparvus TaxID=41427 RepID=A0A182J6U9_ANOAO
MYRQIKTVGVKIKGFRIVIGRWGWGMSLLSLLSRGGSHVIELHQHLDVDRQAGETVVRVGVHGEPGEQIVALQHVPQHVGRDVRIERMLRGRLVLLQRIVRVLQDGRAVQVQCGAQEHRAHVLHVRTGRPEPGGHATGWCCRYQVSNRQRLLQN